MVSKYDVHYRIVSFLFGYINYKLHQNIITVGMFYNDNDDDDDNDDVS